MGSAFAVLLIHRNLFVAPRSILMILSQSFMGMFRTAKDFQLKSKRAVLCHLVLALRLSTCVVFTVNLV